MSSLRVRLRPVADGQTIVNMPPVVGRHVGGIDIQYFDNLDRLEHLLDSRPAGYLQQAFAAGVHIWNGDVALAWRDGAEDVDPRQHGSVGIGSPTYEREDAAC